MSNSVIDLRSRREVEVVKKELTICFRTSEGLRKSLKKIAGQERRTLSGLIVNVLSDYLKHKETSFSDEERRRYPRKTVTLPAFISGADVRETQSGAILDLSLGGMRLSVPKESGIETWHTPLKVLFALAGEKAPVALSCTPTRAHHNNGDIEVAGPFANCDFHNYQKVQAYLLQ